jgi:ATP-dependent RNA helicase DDX5/DBP2
VAIEIQIRKMTVLSDLRKKVKELKKEWKKLKSTQGASKDEVKKLKLKYKRAKEKYSELAESGGERAEAVVMAAQGKRPRTRSISLDLTKRPRTRSFDAPKEEKKDDVVVEDVPATKKRKSSASELAASWLSKKKAKRDAETEELDDTIPEDEDTPSKFYEKHTISIKSISDPSFERPTPMMKFEDSPFPEKLISSLRRAKFARPTPIQSVSWPIVLSGRDLISVARTGSGKTCGFLLPGFLHILKRREKHVLKCGDGPYVLVVAPTRELALQIHMEAVRFGNALQIRCVCVYGGAPKRKQIGNLKRSPTHLLVATPGRLNDLLNIHCTTLRNVSMLILDEADRMLDMGFGPQIDEIIGHMPKDLDRQTLFFTATWPKQVQKAADRLLKMNNVVKINVGESGQLVANEDIEQIVHVIDNRDKTDKLQEILKGLPETHKTIVFIGKKRDCDSIADMLWNQNLKVDSLHGDKDQRERSHVLRQFKASQINILCATDVAARGLDVKDITHVVNYDFPLGGGDKGIEDYVHRIGRTGRAGRKGVAHTFFTHGDRKHANELIQILEGAKQKVPERLAQMKSFGRRRGSGRGRGGRRRGRGGWRGGGRGGRSRGRRW